MKKTVIAEVKWIPKELDGRSSLPPAFFKYMPIIQFTGEDNNNCAWSAEIFCTEMDENLNSIIELSYLWEEAPVENLILGNTFKLYEGARLVGEGKIIMEE